MAEVAAARATGDADRVPLLFGEDAGLTDAIEPAGEVLARIVREAHAPIAERPTGLLAQR